MTDRMTKQEKIDALISIKEEAFHNCCSGDISLSSRGRHNYIIATVLLDLLGATEKQEKAAVAKKTAPSKVTKAQLEPKSEQNKK